MELNQMLLKIIQTSSNVNNHEKDDPVVSARIQLEHGDSLDYFDIESITFPFSNNFYNDLAWYFQDYPLEVAKRSEKEVATQSEKSDEPLDRGIVEKLLRLGQHLGDELLGEDHQLIRMKETIEEQGYENLNVQIETNDDCFFDALWELAILPESNYVLSAVSKTYVRQFTDPTVSFDYPELVYDLTPPPPKQAAGLEHLYQPEETQQQEQDDSTPLRILHIVSRPRSIPLPFSASNAFNQSLSLMSLEGAIDYQIVSDCNWSNIKSLLQSSVNPIHIVHYDGPVLITEDSASFALTSDDHTLCSVTIDEIAQTLVSHSVAALCIDARAYLHNDKSIAAHKGLALIAKKSAKNGLGNVIGLADITDPWTSTQCFNALYSRIPLGLSLGQAVVESRKHLQADTSNPLIAQGNHPFSSWPLLVHYGGQPVTFFNSPASLVNLEDAQQLHTIKETMHGFHETLLPPSVFNTSDALLHRLLSLFDSNKHGVNLLGEQGMGKTHLVHLLSFYLVYSHRVDFAFYFDYDVDFYSSGIIKEMIAPTFDLDRDNKENVVQKLQQTRCVFVLDNVHKILDKNDAPYSQLNEFLQTLQTQGHFIVAIAEAGPQTLPGELQNIELGPMFDTEQRLLRDHTLGACRLDDEKAKTCCNEPRLLATTKGNPWLIKQSVSLLKITDMETFLEEFERHVSVNTNADTGLSRVEQYYEWRWASLLPLWKHLLLIALDVDGLILEMFMLAFNLEEPTDAAKSLLKSYDQNDEGYNKLADFLSTLKHSGFTSETRYGTKIDSRCSRFLLTKKQSPEFETLSSDNTNILCSNIVATGLSYLSKQALSQEHSAFGHYLLMNRRQWAKHLERLWFAGDYRSFANVKSNFDQVLQQAKLGEESAAWGLELLQRSPVIPSGHSASIEAQVTWLQLASSTLIYQNDNPIDNDNNAPSDRNTNVLQDTANLWKPWFDDMTYPVPKETSTLFVWVANFLEVFYTRHKQWQSSIEVCEKAYAFYTQHQAWQKAIQSAKSIIGCSLKNGDTQPILEWEEKILNDVPYKDSPPGFKSQQMLDIVISRLGRQETTLAQCLLDELKTQDDADKLAKALEGVQADIYYQEKAYLDALPYYLNTWQQAVKAEQQEQIELLKTRLLEIEDAVGSEAFDRCFESNLSSDITKPRDL
jgi:ATPase family associated with various cellular activities (AAA)